MTTRSRLALAVAVCATILGAVFPVNSAAQDVSEMNRMVRERICPSPPVKYAWVKNHEYCGANYIERLGLARAVECQMEVERINASIFKYNALVDICTRPTGSTDPVLPVPARPNPLGATELERIAEELRRINAENPGLRQRYRGNMLREERQAVEVREAELAAPPDMPVVEEVPPWDDPTSAQYGQNPYVTPLPQSRPPPSSSAGGGSFDVSQCTRHEWTTSSHVDCYIRGYEPKGSSWPCDRGVDMGGVNVSFCAMGR